jgi:hypothetical protein
LGARFFRFWSANFGTRFRRFEGHLLVKGTPEQILRLIDAARQFNLILGRADTGFDIDRDTP